MIHLKYLGTYIQAFAETGLIGGILYIAMFLNITFTILIILSLKYNRKSN